MKPLIALTVSSKGDGVVTLAGVTAGASIASVVLKKDGEFSIGLVGGQDTRIELNGTRRRQDYSIDLDAPRR